MYLILNKRVNKGELTVFVCALKTFRGVAHIHSHRH
jgi:hypothetical protein